MDMMKNVDLRNQFADCLLSRAGLPYRWGAQDGKRFDCSGLIVWALNEIGVKINDTNSAGLYDLFHNGKCLPEVAPIGALYFYKSKKDGPISHVMSVVRIWDNGGRILIGARGGGPSTTDDARAYYAGAMVDVVTGEYWKSNLCFAVDPFAVVN